MTTLDEQLAAIRAREQAATEGPWRAMPDPDGRLFAIDSDADYITLHNTVPVADATFIAHARTDVPWLLDELKKRDAAVDAVLALHVPIEALNTRHNIKQQVCTGCGADDGNWQVWPCPTVSAITTALTSTPNPLNSKSKDATP